MLGRSGCWAAGRFQRMLLAAGSWLPAAAFAGSLTLPQPPPLAQLTSCTRHHADCAGCLPILHSQPWAVPSAQPPPRAATPLTAPTPPLRPVSRLACLLWPGLPCPALPWPGLACPALACPVCLLAGQQAGVHMPALACCCCDTWPCLLTQPPPLLPRLPSPQPSPPWRSPPLAPPKQLAPP